MKRITDAKKKKIAAFSEQFGVTAAAEKYKVSIGTVRRSRTMFIDGLKDLAVAGLKPGPANHKILSTKQGLRIEIGRLKKVTNALQAAYDAL